MDEKKNKSLSMKDTKSMANLIHKTRPPRYPSESNITENAQDSSKAQGMNDDREIDQAE